MRSRRTRPRNSRYDRRSRVVVFFVYTYSISMESIEEMFEPTLGVYYCNYFYWLLVIYFVLSVIQVGDLGMAMAAHPKSLKDFMSTHLVHRLTHIVSLVAQFVIVRIFYSVCVRSMTAN